VSTGLWHTYETRVNGQQQQQQQQGQLARQDVRITQANTISRKLQGRAQEM
jgi:hypothetical protein